MWHRRKSDVSPLIWIPGPGVSAALDAVRGELEQLIRRRDHWSEEEASRYHDLTAEEFAQIRRAREERAASIASAG